MEEAQYDIAEGMWQAWRATKNLLELDEAGLYPRPLPQDTRKMLERHAGELQAEYSVFLGVGRVRA